MFMIVSYPWPTPSAHVLLTGTGRQAPGRKTRAQDKPAVQPEQERRILVSSKA